MSAKINIVLEFGVVVTTRVVIIANERTMLTTIIARVKAALAVLLPSSINLFLLPVHNNIHTHIKYYLLLLLILPIQLLRQTSNNRSSME